ncbi:MAG: T9SS type A sorting domain-containing protein [Bacteroidota bacterium]
MKSNACYLKVLLLLGIGLLVQDWCWAGQPLRIGQRDFPQVAEQLVCTNPNRVGVSTTEIVDFLERCLAQTNPGNTYYSPPIPRVDTCVRGRIQFEWDPIPAASLYIVNSLELRGGTIDRHSTAGTSLSIGGLAPELYLFAFQTAGPDVDHRDLIIITEDKDLGLVEVFDDELCNCSGDFSPLILPTLSLPCLSYTPDVALFEWTNSCLYNKYKFKVKGTLSGQPFDVDYHLVYKDNSSVKDSIFDLELCNPEMPISPLEDKLTIANVIRVGLTKDNVQFELLGLNATGLDVDAEFCGCLKQFGSNGSPNFVKSNKAESVELNADPDLQITPNPFSDHLSIRVQSREQQTMVCRLYNLRGQLVRSAEQIHSVGTKEIQVPTAELSPGLYLLHITGPEKDRREWVIKL